MTADRRIIELREHAHPALPRREFLARLAKISVGSAAALAALPLFTPSEAQARQVSPDDRHLHTESFNISVPGGHVNGYLAHPQTLARGEKMPAIVVIHDDRGLGEYIQDVTRRAGLAGYFAVAPDGLSSAGGTPEDPKAAHELFAKTEPERITHDIFAMIPWLVAHPLCNQKIGVLGFSSGGGLALRACIDAAGIDCAVAFYGAPLSADQVQRLKVPVLLNDAEDDGSDDAGISSFKARLDANHVPYELYTYPGTRRGFHDDTTRAHYDKDAAKLAWARTIQFFDQHLKT